ncbi:hypothetical protein [Staphylococcus capitis]|uniref:hypothetical protein n=1 Tax=Staphylococcus capitis TaxID=29388 RepID=UPI0030C3CA90
MNKKVFNVLNVFIICAAIIVLIVFLYIDIKATDTIDATTKDESKTSISDMLKENNKKAEYEGIIASPVEKDKYYRNKFYDAERKIKNNQSADKEIKTIKGKIDGERQENRHFKNKKNITSGYKSALISLNELNENNKKGNKKNNDLLIDNINEQLAYSQREVFKE